jgi:hypothetical protein
MRLSKINRERISRLQASVIDCDYTIKRIEREGKQSELANWITYRDDLVKVINAIRNGSGLNI